MNTIIVEAGQIEVRAFLLDQISKNIAQPVNLQKIVGVPDQFHWIGPPDIATDLVRWKRGYEPSHIVVDDDSKTNLFMHAPVDTAKG